MLTSFNFAKTYVNKVIPIGLPNASPNNIPK